MSTLYVRGAICSAFALIAATIAFADPPQITAVSLLQNTRSREVVISYTLANGPAIVTFDIVTNGVPVGFRTLDNATGDRNRIVATGDHTITWRPYDAGWNNVVDAKAIVKAWPMSAPPDYMVVDLDNDVTGDTSGLHPNLAYYTCEEALPGWPATSNDYRRTKLVMRRIKARGVEWSMGSPTDEADRSSSREPLHLVTLTNDYWIGIYELTQKQYSYITQNKCAWKDLPDADMRPANSNSVNSLRGNPVNGYAWPENGHTVDGSLAGFRTKTGIDFDLPTEAQWEYAARAGSSRERYYSGITNLDEIAWYADNSGGEPQIVGRKKPNAWGLYDTIGNIGEMCIDMIDDNAAYPDLGPVEPVGKRESSSNRATRGGRYDSLANDCRVAFRQTNTKYSGKQIYGGWRLVAPITFTW